MTVERVLGGSPLLSLKKKEAQRGSTPATGLREG